MLFTFVLLVSPPSSSHVNIVAGVLVGSFIFTALLMYAELLLIKLFTWWLFCSFITFRFLHISCRHHILCQRNYYYYYYFMFYQVIQVVSLVYTFFDKGIKLLPAYRSVWMCAAIILDFFYVAHNLPFLINFSVSLFDQ